MTAQPATSRASSSLFVHAIPSLILAVVATVLFWWNPFGKPPQWASLHLVMQSNVPGNVQLLYDVDGTGLHKGHLVVQPIQGGNRTSHIQFRIPSGRLVNFILDGLDRPAEVEIDKCWIAAVDGEVAAILPPTRLKGSLINAVPGSAPGSVRFQTQINGTPQGIMYVAHPAIDLTAEPPPPLWQIALVFLGTLVVCVFASTALAPRRERCLEALRCGFAWTQARPRRSILLAAVLSVTMCAFPVIFGGKSYISPNNGMPLLYPKFPTTPGVPEGERAKNPVGSDIGATMYWHLPASMIEHRAIFHDGEFPLWTRYTWCGGTFFGQLFTMIGDPLHVLTVITGGAAWAWDAFFVIAKILFALGIGWLVWRMTGSLPTALLCTLSAPYIGFFAYRFCHVATFSVCYAPWLLIPWVEGVRTKTHRQAAAWAGLLLLAEWCQINSGTAKEAVMLLLFLNAAGLWIVLTAPESWGWRLRRSGLFIWAGVLFVLLSTPLWLVFLEALGKSWTQYDKPQIYQAQPGLIIGLFDDIFYRQVEPLEFLFNPSANFFVLLGVAWALVRIRTLIRDRYFVAALLAAVPALAFVFGIVPPWLAASIPFIKNIYHFDDTFSCILFVVLFIIAGFGVRECLARRESKEWIGDWVCAMAIIGVLLASYFGFTQAIHRTARSFVEAGDELIKSPFFVDYTTVLVIAIVILPLAMRAALRDRQAGPIWALVAACMFATLHFRYGMYSDTRFDHYGLTPKARVDLRNVPSPAVAAIHQATATEPARALGLAWTMVPGFNTVLGLESISGPDALMDPTMLQLVEALHIPRKDQWWLVVSVQAYPAAHRGLDFLNVRYLLGDLANSAPEGVRKVSSSDLDVFESDTAWPRAFFTDTVMPYRGVEDFVHQIETGDGRPFAGMAPEVRSKLPLPAKDLAQRVVAKASNYRLTNNTTTFEIDALSPGVAVLSEYDPAGDIRAYVDGQSVPCLLTNEVFRGVYINKPGHHVVKFAYWPHVLGPALWVGALGLVGFLVSFGIWFRVGPPPGWHGSG